MGNLTQGRTAERLAIDDFAQALREEAEGRVLPVDTVHSMLYGCLPICSRQSCYNKREVLEDLSVIASDRDGLIRVLPVPAE